MHEGSVKQDSTLSAAYNGEVGFNYFHYARGVFRPKQLESVFLFITSTCNSKCRTCFYWDELNQGRDLTFAQIQRLSETAPDRKSVV